MVDVGDGNELDLHICINHSEGMVPIPLVGDLVGWLLSFL